MEDARMDRITSFRDRRRRYTTLRVVAFVCGLLGAILLVISGGLLVFGLHVLAGGAATLPPNPSPILGPQFSTIPWPLLAQFSLIWSVGILFSGLQMLALGAFLWLMIHLEENTRVSAQVLDGLRSRLEAFQEAAQRLFES
jgi:hypothetical protein